ncbi:tripartite tricarboxylate transporter substrate-binding protein [Roseomonas sp. BN140053]|uniref:tripartite tricarboxylate transporter substrate-binding protein n=1 Tax=Roseomonas sp. BN140053 TaxID=3391898 RepID=UPI0039E85246
MVSRRQLASSVAAAVLATALARPSHAQRLPDGAVTIIVPSTPGTGHDTLARLCAPYLQQLFGQAVVVENRAGASGNIGSHAVARAAPDGRTLMMHGDPLVMNTSLYRDLPYDPVRSFAPIIQLTTADLVLAVNPDVPAETAAAFVSLAGAQPGTLDYASPGNGTPHHLAMAMFALSTGIRITHVPYRGTSQALQDLIGRRITAMMVPVHVAVPLAREGQIRILGIGATQRSAIAPEVPTLQEAGISMGDTTMWYGLLGPAGLPGDFVQRVNLALNAWLLLPATQAALRTQGMAPAGGSPEQFGAKLARDVQRWATLVREAGISVD